MRVKVELEQGETLEDAENFLAKSVKAKSECIEDERYADEYLNEFHTAMCQRHANLLEGVLKEIEQEILKDIHER